MKSAILVSCLMSAGLIFTYSIVMDQIKAMENFYGNIDQYAQTAVSSNNSVSNPYIPQTLVNVSQPLKNSPLQNQK